MEGAPGTVTGGGCEEGDPAALLDKGIHSPRILGLVPQHRFSRALGSKHPFQVTHLTTEGVAGTYEAAGILVCSLGTNQGILVTCFHSLLGVLGTKGKSGRALSGKSPSPPLSLGTRAQPPTPPTPRPLARATCLCWPGGHGHACAHAQKDPSTPLLPVWLQ